MDQQVQQTAEPSMGSTQPRAGNEGQRPHGSPRRRWPYILGAISLVVLLIGAAFVGGRLLARRHTVHYSGPGVFRLSRPAELPKEPPETSGPVQKVEGKVITLEEPVGGRGVIYSGPEGTTKEGEWKQIEVVVTHDTKIYKAIPPSPEEMEKGGEFQQKVEEATLADVQVDEQIEVWGQRSGDRITAEVIYIQRAFPIHFDFGH